MFKKFIIGCFTLMMSSPVLAVTVKVEAVTPFSTENPQETMTVKLLEDCELTDTIILHKNDLIYGKTTDVVSPKRLKRNASFAIIPLSYSDSEGNIHTFNEQYKGKYSIPIDKKELAKNATLSVGSFFIKGLSLGVNAIEGAVKNEEGNRFKSSAMNVYENTPFSYVETGYELNILTGDIFWLKFKTKQDEQDEQEEQSETTEEETLPNYDYTLPTD